MKKIAVLLADGFEEVEAVTPIDFLRRAGVEVLVAGIGGKTVKGAHGVSIHADLELAELPENLDGVVLPGGMPGSQNIADSPVAMDLIRKTLAEGKILGAICAAPAVVLGAHGLLRGRRFTCYPGFEKDVLEADFSPERVVVDGNLITSRGPGTAAEFALVLVGKVVNPEEAEKIRKGTLQK